MLFANLQVEIAGSIQSVETQIAQLQQRLADLQAYQQQIGSVETACESALSQVDTALAMLGHVCPDQIATFQNAIASRFEPTKPQLPTSPDEPQPSPEPDSTPNNGNGRAEIIEVTGIEIESTEWTDYNPSNGNGHAKTLGEKDLKGCDRPLLIKLAKLNKIKNATKLTAKELRQKLDGIATQQQLDSLTPTQEIELSHP